MPAVNRPFEALRHNRQLLGVAAGVLLLAAVVGTVVTAGSGPATRTITAQFASTPGLYAGNEVDVLGIDVGRVTSIKPGPDYVTVTMAIDDDVPLPPGAKAVLMAPEVVSDRFVQIGPAYVSGPTMPAGTVIPLSDTAIPESVDNVVDTLDELANQLGPAGANKNGALSNLIHQLAVNLGPNGQDFHAAIVNFSQALGALSTNAPALASTINNLGQLSQALADNSSQYESFANNLAQVSQILNNDKVDINQTMQSLATLFDSLTSFIDADGAELGTSITNLSTFAHSLASEQSALAQAYDLAPLSLQNLDNAINLHSPGGPAIVGRNDPVASTTPLFNQVCGEAALRFLVLLASGTQTNPLTQATTTDTLCGIGNALTSLNPPPGSPSGPNMTLSALVG
jgi:phospholipid/cholesterol/gamma-HCH transport system substrate-binding protein